MTELPALITAFTTLFIIIDPPGLAPLFLAMTQGRTAKQRRAIGLRACIISFVLMLVFQKTEKLGQRRRSNIGPQGKRRRRRRSVTFLFFPRHLRQWGEKEMINNVFPLVFLADFSISMKLGRDFRSALLIWYKANRKIK